MSLLKPALLVVSCICMVGIGNAALSGAQAQTAKRSQCPSPYAAVSDFCFNDTTADVVLPGSPKVRLAFKDSDCRAGYKILVKSLCFNAASGDIEIANVKSGAGKKRVAK